MKDLKIELNHRVDEVLFFMWDPLGMSYEPACRDEYSSYIDRVSQLLIENKSAQEVSQFLIQVCKEEMEYRIDEEHSFKVAEYLVNCRDWISEEYLS